MERRSLEWFFSEMWQKAKEIPQRQKANFLKWPFQVGSVRISQIPFYGRTGNAQQKKPTRMELAS
jgi:hypothetical protein